MNNNGRRPYRRYFEDRSFHNRRNARFQDAPEADREVTPEELQTITIMGFDDARATHAIRMARFNLDQAVDILLSNEAGLTEYIKV